jgi:hypothetical protein
MRARSAPIGRPSIQARIGIASGLPLAARWSPSTPLAIARRRRSASVPSPCQCGGAARATRRSMPAPMARATPRTPRCAIAVTPPTIRGAMRAGSGRRSRIAACIASTTWLVPATPSAARRLNPRTAIAFIGTPAGTGHGNRATGPPQG